MKILQLSDIHYGGDYGGKFRCELNFLSTLYSAIDSADAPYDLIVITGDLADNGYTMHYTSIRESLERTGIPYFVLPGNHDDVAAMCNVFGEHTVPECGYVIRNGILFWDNCGQDVANVPEGEYSTVFCHYPVGYAQHAFMEQHAHAHADELYGKLLSKGVEYVFCGHFHCRSTAVEQRVRVKVAGATQCQLDRHATECVPLDPDQVPGLPSYATITMGSREADPSYFIVSTVKYGYALPDYPAIQLHMHGFGEVREAVNRYIKLLTRLERVSIEGRTGEQRNSVAAWSGTAVATWIADANMFLARLHELELMVHTMFANGSRPAQE